MTIIFYDIPSALPANTWSPNTWKPRYCLNYKEVPYKTEWVEFPDIEAHCIKHGIKPTSTKANGAPHYTLPALYDPSTGVYLSDSLPIAEYLEKTFPDKPSIFPDSTAGLQATFDDLFRDTALSTVWPFIFPVVQQILNPSSAEYFRRTREKAFGKTLEDLLPKGEVAKEAWGKFQDGLEKVAGWYEKAGGPFLLGQTVSWADFVVGSWLIWMRTVWGEDSEQWKDISSWQGGRWKKLLDDLKPYQTVV